MSRPVDAGLGGAARRHAKGADAAAARTLWETGHSAHQRLADGDGIGCGKERAEPCPILFIGEREGVGADRLINIDAKRRTKAAGDSGYLRQAEMVRLHHHGDEGDWHAEPNAARRLLVDEPPIAGAALPILLGLRRVVERKFDVLEHLELFILEQRDAMAVRSDGELERP